MQILSEVLSFHVLISYSRTSLYTTDINKNPRCLALVSLTGLFRAAILTLCREDRNQLRSRLGDWTRRGFEVQILVCRRRLSGLVDRYGGVVAAFLVLSRGVIINTNRASSLDNDMPLSGSNMSLETILPSRTS